MRKVCLKLLPGGTWERPCKGPPRSTGATPPLPRHTREARPKTALPAHRRERRGDPRPHGSGTEATGAAPRDCAARGQGCRSMGKVAVPRPPPPRHQVVTPRPSQHRRDRWLHGQNGNDLSSSRRQRRQHVWWARGHGRANSLPQRDGRLDRRASLGSSLHGNWCRLSPPLWGVLRGGQLAGEARRGTSCGSRHRLEDLPRSQIGRTVTLLAKEKRKIRVGTYEVGARTKIS
jgi:hypothetical protein